MTDQNINFFEYGQLLSKNYSTVLRNQDVKERLIDVFDGHIDESYFKDNGIKPRKFINDFILRYYPNEIAIKSSFINNVLSKSQNHVTIFELSVGNSRLDLCKINRISTAYEIKTELDSPTRLEAQMTDYFNTFDKVYLICSKKNFDEMIDKVPNECGVYTYHLTKTGKYVFKKRRNAIKSNEPSPYVQLLSLTKRDLHIYFNCDYHLDKEKMIAEIISLNSTKHINKIFKRCLRNKYTDKWDFLLENRLDILEIDYQWFYKNQLSPQIVYQ